MGKGSGTSQSNVTKRPRDYSSDAATMSAAGSGGGGGFDQGSTATCLISFKPKIQLSSEVAIGTKFVLVSNGQTDELQLISGGRNIGTYTGSRIQQLKQCIAGGYIYNGKVDSFDQSAVVLLANCTVTGSCPA
jgi:hypothetical protein